MNFAEPSEMPLALSRFAPECLSAEDLFSLLERIRLESRAESLAILRTQMHELPICSSITLNPSWSEKSSTCSEPICSPYRPDDISLYSSDGSDCITYENQHDYTVYSDSDAGLCDPPSDWSGYTSEEDDCDSFDSLNFTDQSGVHLDTTQITPSCYSLSFDDILYGLKTSFIAYFLSFLITTNLIFVITGRFRLGGNTPFQTICNVIIVPIRLFYKNFLFLCFGLFSRFVWEWWTCGMKDQSGFVDIDIDLPILHYNRWSPDYRDTIEQAFRTHVIDFIESKFRLSFLLDLRVRIGNIPKIAVTLTLPFPFGEEDTHSSQPALRNFFRSASFFMSIYLGTGGLQCDVFWDYLFNQSGVVTDTITDAIVGETTAHTASFPHAFINFIFSPLRIITSMFWTPIFVNQNGRDRATHRRNERSRTVYLQNVDEYKELRRQLLNLQKLEMDEAKFVTLQPTQVLNYQRRLQRLLSKMNSVRQRLDVILDMENQSGSVDFDINSDVDNDSETSSLTDPVDNLFGDTDMFTSSVRGFINMYMPHLSDGEKYRTTLQVCLWSYEILTAESIPAFVRKILLLGSHVFPDNCAILLEQIVKTLPFINQDGKVRTAASWMSSINTLWKKGSASNIGKLKKMAMLIGAVVVYREKLSQLSISDLKDLIGEPIEAITKTAPTEYLSYFLEVMEWFTQNLADTWETGDITQLFKNRDIAVTITNDFTQLSDEYNRMKTYGRSLMVDSDLTSFREKCVKLKALLKANAGHPKLGGLLTYRTMTHNIDMWISCAQNKFRNVSPTCKKPFAMCIWGYPETGKSDVSATFWQACAMRCDWSYEDHNTCHINVEEKYQSTADHQDHVHVDDKSQALCTRTETNDSMILIRLINSFRWYVNKSESAEKGNHTLNPRVVTVTSQTRHMYAHQDINEPGALYRRFDVYAHVTVKPQFATKGGAINHASLTQGDDPHLISLTRPISVGVSNDGKSIIQWEYITFDFNDGNGEIAMFEMPTGKCAHVVATLCEAQQARETRNVDRVTSVIKCPHNLPERVCFLCETNQSDDVMPENYISSRKALIGTIQNVKEQVFKKPNHNPFAPSMVNNAGEDGNFAGLYYLSLFYSRYLFFIPTFPSLEGKWYNPMSWYRRFLASETWSSRLGVYGVISIASLFSFSSVFFPFAAVVGLSNAYITLTCGMGTLLCFPAVAYDTFCIKIKGYSITQFLQYESTQRRLKWLSDNRNKVICGSLLIITSIITLVMLSRFYTSDGMVNNGGDFSNLNSSKAIKKPDEWSLKEVNVSNYATNTGNHTRSQIIGDSESAGMIGDRTAYCVNGMKKSSNAFPLCGNYWIMPYHYVVKSIGIPVQLHIMSMNKNGGRYIWRPGAEKVSWMRIPDHDLAICHIPEAPPQRDMRDLLRDPSSEVGDTGRLIFKCGVETGEVKVSCVPLRFLRQSLARSTDDPSIKYQSINYTLFGMETRGGMCCSPVVNDTKHPAIIAFHTMGIGMVGRGDLVTKHEVLKVLDELVAQPLCSPIVNADSIILQGGVSHVVHTKHVARFTEQADGVTLLGQANNLNIRSTKMTTGKTPIYDDVLDQFGIDDKWMPAPNNPKWLAKHTMFKNISDMPLPDPAEVEVAYLDLKQQYDDHFDSHPESLVGLTKMSLHDNIHGINGVSGYEPINRKTSKGNMGLIFPNYTNSGPKSEVLRPVYDDGTEEGFHVEYSDDLVKELDVLKEQLKDGQRVGFVASTNEKDETVKKTKKFARIFSCMPLHFLILQREYFLSFSKWFRDWNFVSECGVGVNCRSRLWDTFARFLSYFNKDRCIAGDFKAYDQRMSAIFMRAAYNIIEHCYRRAGYSEEDLATMGALSMDVVYPIYEFNTDLVMPAGSNPSGHSLTVIINSIVNSLYMRYAFKKLYPNLVFSEYVKLMTYGDDNVMNVSEKVPLFNQNKISEILGAIGIVYTDAHKSEVFEDYVNFSEVTFLKRSFNFNPDLGVYSAPIEEDSLFKSMLYMLPSDAENMIPQTQMGMILCNVMDEAFFYGPQKFEEYRTKLMYIAKKNQLLPYLPTRTFDSYVARVKVWQEDYTDQCFENQSGYVSHGLRVRAPRNYLGVLPKIVRLLWIPILLMSTVESLKVLGLQTFQQNRLGGCYNLNHYPEINQIATTMNMTTSSMSSQQNLDFSDGTPQPCVSYNNVMAAETNAMSTDELPLSEFFSRPIKIATIPWTPALAGFGTTINPWTLFFGNKRVINRINNFALLSANLHIKITINGNGFYYGRCMVDYLPLPGFDTSTPRSLSAQSSRTPASQRLNLQVDPTTSSGGEMILPFIWMFDKLSIPTAQWTMMGELNFRELNTLQHANAATTPLELNVFAWADNVSLSLPTSTNSTALVNQSGDEYGGSKFSNMATALSGIASGMSDMPIIGDYARASQLAVRGAGALAGMAGFSRPPNDDPEYIVRRTITNLVNTDATDGSVKLTVDSKQELSVGSESLNISTPDEMDIKCIASKQSYLTGFFWDLTHAVDDPLFYAKVSPMAFNTELATPTNFYPTACMFATMPFRLWRGKMKYRFQVVASSFHRGRLLVTWNPSTAPSNELNVLTSAIIDLDKERDVVMEIPWGLPSTMANVPTPSLTDRGYLTNPGAAVYTTDQSYDNGTLAVYVLNTLAVPNTAANALVGVNVYVSMEDAEYAIPDDELIGNLVFTNQSGVEPDIDVPMPIKDDVDHVMGHTEPSSTTMSTYIGERITSFRTLLKRYCFHMSNVLTPPSANTRVYYSARFSTFPYYTGTVTSGIYSGVNNCRTTFINYLTPAFLAQRGGVRTKLVYVPTGSTIPYFISVRRTRGQNYVNNSTDISTSTSTESTLNGTAAFAFAGSGIDITNPAVQPILEIEHPFQRNTRFATAKDRSNTKTHTPVKEAYLLNSYAQCAAISERHIILRYVAAAEDFSLLLFQGAPAFTISTIVVS